jgi:hypothetical protein
MERFIWQTMLAHTLPSNAPAATCTIASRGSTANDSVAVGLAMVVATLEHRNAGRTRLKASLLSTTGVSAGSRSVAVIHEMRPHIRTSLHAAFPLASNTLYALPEYMHTRTRVQPSSGCSQT